MFTTMLEETEMANQRTVNRVLLIGGIASFLFTIIAAIFGLPVWAVILGATANAILHLYYRPVERADASEMGRPQENQPEAGMMQENQPENFGMEKVLRIREEYEKKIRNIEEEKGQRIEELERDFAAEKEKARHVEELEQDLAAEKEKARRIEELEQDLAREKERFRQLKNELERSVSTNNASMPNSASILPELDDEKDKLVKVDVVKFATKVSEEYARKAQEAGISIHVAGNTGSIYVQASEKMLIILFRNIIDNAIKYMNRKGIMQITITSLGDDIFIAIKDSGLGLAENETAHIFELNYQGSNRTSGNGLGLAQTKAIVEYYGGMIYASSSKDKGMGIYIHLPAEKEEFINE